MASDAAREAVALELYALGFKPTTTELHYGAADQIIAAYEKALTPDDLRRLAARNCAGE